MLKTLLWDLIFFALRTIWGISRDFIAKAFEEAQLAEQLTDQNGKHLTGSEKYHYVFESLVIYAEDYSWGAHQTSVINTVIELVVSYMKSMKR